MINIIRVEGKIINKKIEDRFAENKKTVINKFIKRENTSQISFGIFEVTLAKHRPNKKYVCYICDRKIEDVYYSRKRTGSGNNKKLCIYCISKFIDFFNIDLDKWDLLMKKKLKRIVEMENYLRAYETKGNLL